MKLNQIVYVVANAKSEVVLGAYNNYYEALNAIEGCNSADVSITPVLVDAPVDTYRAMCYCENTANALTQEEIDYAYDLEEEAEPDEDEDEDEDEYYGYDEDNEDDECEMCDIYEMHSSNSDSDSGNVIAEALNNLEDAIMVLKSKLCER